MAERKFGGRTTYHGKKVNWGLWYALQAANKMLATKHFGGEKEALTMWQGCWSRAVGASAGTHAGSGTADITPYNWQNRNEVFRLLGFACWMRPAIKGLWVKHMHFVMAGDGGAAASARRQVEAFWRRPSRDGLAGNRVDTQKPKMLCRPLYVYPLKEAGKVGKYRVKVGCHSYTQQTVSSPRWDDRKWEPGEVVNIVAVTRDRDTRKYWLLTADGRCFYKDNFEFAA